MVVFDMQQTPSSGFSFRQRYERIDWRKLASLDVDSIARNLDFQTLQDNILNVTFCNIESEIDVQNVDGNFIKLFKLAQLTIEYLLHSQDFLSGVVTALEEKLAKLNDDLSTNQDTVKKLQTEIDEIKKESHKRKKMLIAQQQIMHSGANSYHKCPHCPKAFINDSFLQSHFIRRHQDSHGISKPVEATNFGNSQGQIQHQKQNLELESEILQLKRQLQNTENQMMDEVNRRNKEIQQEQEKKEEKKRLDMEAWKKQQLDSHKADIEKIRDMYTNQLHEMTAKYEVSEQNLSKIKKMSALGNKLEDDDEIIENNRKRDSAIQNEIELKLERNNKIWEEKLELMKQQHAEQLNIVEMRNLQFENKNKKKLHELEIDLKLTKEKAEKLTTSTVNQQPSPREKIKTPVKQTKINQFYPEDEEDSTTVLKHCDCKISNVTIKVADYQQTTPNATLKSAQSTLQNAGTESLNSTLSLVHHRVTEELKAKPNILDKTRDDVLYVLSKKLQRLGVDHNEQKYGITNEKFKKVMKNSVYDRQENYEKKYQNFKNLRLEISNLVESIVENVEEVQPNSGKPPVSPPTKRRSVPNETTINMQNVNKSASLPIERRNISPHSKPVPAPRSTSPVERSSPMRDATRASYDSLGTGTSLTLSRTYTTESYTKTTTSFSESDDDEEYDDESESDEEPFTHKVPDPADNFKMKVIDRKQTTTKNNVKTSFDDWDDDEISELDEQPQSKPIISQKRNQMPAASNQPKYQQAQGKQHMKKNKNNSNNNNFSSSDSEFQVTPRSDIDDNETPRQGKRPNTRNSTTDYSTNTIPTSNWGGSSRAAQSSSYYDDDDDIDDEKIEAV